MEKTLLRQVYYWDYKSRFPKTYANHFEPTILANLTSSEDFGSENRPYTFLTLYDHKYYLDRNPMIVRVMVPLYDLTSNKRVRHREIPIDDMALFVYNSEEIRTNQTHSAIVSFDGKKLSTLNLDHNRVRVVERESLRREALHNGVYLGRKYILPLMSLRRFWQQGFVKFLSFRQDLFYAKSNSPTIFKKQYQTLLVQSARFLGDRINPKQYWSSLLVLPGMDSFLKSSVFLDEVSSMESLYKQNVNCSNLRSTQSTEDIKDYHFAFKAMTII